MVRDPGHGVGHDLRMATYIAFLRAINLGPTRKFPKDAIIAAVESIGFTDVETYINTGNVRFCSTMRSRARMEGALEAASTADEVAKVGGRAVHLLLRDQYHEAKLTNALVEKHLGVATNRNLTVIRTLAEKWGG